MSFISDVFNRILRRNIPLLEEQNVSTNSDISQYRYNDIINWLNNTGLINEYYTQLDILNNENDLYYPSAVHGIDHTSRVMLFADVLANLDKLDNRTKDMLLVAARYHDIGRIDNKETKEHGILGANKVKELELLKGYSKKDQKIIEFAINQHSKSKEENEEALSKIPKRKRKDYEIILYYLKDADALDRFRIANKNMKLDPSRLRTNTSKGLVDFAQNTYKNYNKIKLDYNNYKLLKNQPQDIQMLYDYVKEYIININWVIQNKEVLNELYNNGVLDAVKYLNVDFEEIINNKNLLYATSQIQKGDFETLRNLGYNITYETFLNIVSKYKDGTIQKLRDEGKLNTIFSKSTYLKYGNEQTFDENININNISDDKLLELINKNLSTKILNSTFEENYLLYKNLYNNPLGFELFTKNAGIDQGIRSIHGLLEVFKNSDINKFSNIGYNFSAKDIICLFNDYTPEEYRNIMDSNNIQELIKYNPLKEKDNGNNHNNCFTEMKKIFPNLSLDEFDNDYKLYNTIYSSKKFFSNIPEISKYTIKEIFHAYTSLSETETYLKDIKGKDVSLTGKDLINYIEFSKNNNFIVETNSNDKNEISNFILENNSLINNPFFIKYISKKNKVFRAENPNDIINYNKYCIDKILLDPTISLSQAKSSLINSLFTIDAPNKEMEENVIDELYFYQKYKKEGEIITINDESSIDSAINDLISIIDSAPTIEDFKNNLYEKSKNISNINFDTIYNKIQNRMHSYSSNDIVSKLNQSEQEISKIKTEYIMSPNGEEIPIKPLTGQNFNIAVTTVMPYCSSISRKRFNMDKNLIKNNMLNRPLNPDNRCTSLLDQTMMGVTESALLDNELRYSYVPANSNQISISGVHDLSSKKKDFNGNIHRISTRTVQQRSFEDIVHGTNEEHNECVINGVIPRYIVCIDQISDIAIEKYQQLKKEYEIQNIDIPLEILYIDSKGKYLPQIKNTWKSHINQISEEIDNTGTISNETFNKFFNKRERNITLETMQMVNSTSYRDELWDPNNNVKSFKELSNIMEKVSSVAPKEYLGDILNQIDLILERTSSEYLRYYDHSFKSQVDIKKFEEIKDLLNKRLGIDNKSKVSINSKENLYQGFNK